MQPSPELELDNLRNSIKPSKLRLAVVKTEETYEGIVVIPQNKVQTHKLGTVVATGAEVDVGVSVGDIIMYQANAMFEAGVTHLVNETPVAFMHKGDAIGKLSSRVVSVDTFQILGDFILLEEISLSKVGDLYLPESAVPPPEFRVLQIGATVHKDDDPLVQTLAVGEEIFIDRTRATPIRLGLKTFFYLPKGWIHGKKL